MIIAASLALAAAVPAGPASAPVVEALARVSVALEQAAACPSTPEEEESFLRLNGRSGEITAEAEALFGPLLAATFEAQEAAGENPKDCAAATALIREAPGRVDAAAAALAEQTARMPGVWLGTMRICGATMARAEPAPVDFEDGFVLTLPPELRGPLAEESRAHMDFPIAVRVDGRQISAPVVREPITGGQLQISGVAPEEVANLRLALARGC